MKVFFVIVGFCLLVAFTCWKSVALASVFEKCRGVSR